MSGGSEAGEEADWFRDRIVRLKNEVAAVPELYAQDGEGNNAVVYLHYFYGGSDWYITELDPQDRVAFGLVILNGDTENAELGYISLAEITSLPIEIDMHFEPTTMGEIKAKHGLPFK